MDPLQHSCLILHGGHDKQRLRSGTVSVAPSDAARLNLKISQQSEEIDELKCLLKKESENHQKTYAEYGKLRKQVIEAQMDSWNNPSENIFSDKSGSSDDDEIVLKLRPIESESKSEGSSPKPRPATVGDSRSRENFDLLHHLHATVAEKNAKIESLEKTLKEMEVTCHWTSLC